MRSNDVALLFDSNVFIYLSKGNFQTLNNWFSSLESPRLYASRISKLEVLGYHLFQPQEKKFLLSIFERFEFLDISANIIDHAIQLRQQKRMSLADSIIAATCQIHDVELCTYNVDDFKHLEMKLSELPGIS